MKKLVFIGNSIVNGFPFSRGRSFPGQIRSAIDDGSAGFTADIINKGINGQTSDEVLSRFDHDVIDQRPAAAFILTGTNDFIFETGDPENGYANLKKMVAKAEGAGITPVLMTPLFVEPQQAARTWMAESGTDYDRVNRQIDHLSGMIRQGQDLFVDTNLAYEQYARELENHPHLINPPHAFRDGVHPTEQGYAFIARTVVEWIQGNGGKIGLD